MNRLVDLGKFKPVTISFNDKEFILGEVDMSIIAHDDGQVSLIIDGINPSPFARQQLKGILRLSSQQGKLSYIKEQTEINDDLYSFGQPGD